MTHEPEVQTFSFGSDDVSRIFSKAMIPAEEVNPDTITSVLGLLIDSAATAAEGVVKLDWTTIRVGFEPWAETGGTMVSVFVRAAS